MGDAILDAILSRLAGGAGAAPAAPSTPAAAPVVSEKERAEAINDIIAKAYAMPGVPEHVRRRCAKHQLVAEYGQECATKYLRGRKRKVPGGGEPAGEAPPATETPPAAAPPATKAPEATSTPAAVPAPAKTAEPTVLALDSELKKILAAKEAAPP